MASKSPPPPEMAEVEVRIHAKTIITILACGFSSMAQLTAVVGSGLLANYMAILIDHPTQTVWYSSMITIFTVVLCPPMGEAAEYWGRKWFIVIPTGLGCVGSIIISRATNFATIMVGFALLGIAFGSQGLSMAVCSEVLPRKHRPFGQAAMTVLTSAGGALGLLVGGRLLQNGNVENCRIFWYIVAGFFFLATICCIIGYNPPSRELQLTLTTKEKLRRLDWVGYGLFGSGLVLFCMALSWSDNPYPWSDPQVFATFLVGMIMIIAFGLYEGLIKKDGMLNARLWNNRNFAISLAAIFVEGLAYFAANSYFAFELSILYGDDLFIGAINFSLVFWIALVLTFVFGYWSARRKALRTPMMVGSLSFLIFFICLATSKLSTPRAAFWVYTIFSGMGNGSIIPLSMAAAQFTTSPELIGIATALMTASRSLGGSVALAINNALFNSALDEQIPSKVGGAAMSMGLNASSLPNFIAALTSNGAVNVMEVPGVTPEIAQAGGTALKEAYLIAFRNLWISSAAFCGLLVLCVCFVSDQEDQFTKHIDAPAEKELVIAQMALERKSPAYFLESNTGLGSEKDHPQHRENIDTSI